jgi:four helix bundle protein
MATVERFEDLVAWKTARELVREVYRHTRAGPLARDFPLRDQLCRAAISIMANIAEGFERGGDREFLKFLGIAKGSCGELRSLVVIAFDQNYLTADQRDDLQHRSSEVSRQIAGLMKYLNASSRPGRRLGANTESITDSKLP